MECKCRGLPPGDFCGYVIRFSVQRGAFRMMNGGSAIGGTAVDAVFVCQPIKGLSSWNFGAPKRRTIGALQGLQA